MSRINFRTVLLCLGLTLAVLAAYANHFQNGFHFDDSHTIGDNGFIRNLRNVPSFFVDASRFSSAPGVQVYRPVLSTSLAIDYWLGHGYKPFFFHLSTFIWFAVQLVLMFFLFRRIMDRADPPHAAANLWTALLATACYGLHPANAETVNYIIQRGDLYNTLGVVASLLCFAAWPGQRKWGWYLLPAIAAYLSKAPALIFPFVLLAYVFLIEQGATFGNRAEDRKNQKNRKKWVAALRATLPAFAVTAAAAILTLRMTPAGFRTGGDPGLYRLTQPWVALHYFKSFFLPTDLSADTDWTYVSGPFSGEALAGYLFVALLGAAAVYASRSGRTRPISFGILWFLLALLPTSLMPLTEVTNDHRMFFPFVGLALAVCWGLRLLLAKYTVSQIRSRIPERPLPHGRGSDQSRARQQAVPRYVGDLLKRCTKTALARAPVPLIVALAVVVLAAEAAGTRERNKVWHSEESLWRDVTVKSPGNARGLMNYGLVFLSRREYAAALPYLERAELLRPNYAPVEANLGIAYGGLERDAEAVRHFERALALTPDMAEPHLYYGRWLKEKGRLAESQAQLEAAVRANRLSFPARDLLTQVYTQQGNRQAADQLLEETVTLAFDEETARRYMAERARREQAAGGFPENSPEGLLNLSARFCNSGNYRDCLAAAKKALELRPAYAEAYSNMAAAYIALQQWDEGIQAARQAIRIQPDHEAARSNLEWALSHKPKTGSHRPTKTGK